MDEEKIEQSSVDNINSNEWWKSYFDSTLALLDEMGIYWNENKDTQWQYTEDAENIWWNSDEEKELIEAENWKNKDIAKVVEQTTQEVEDLNQDVLPDVNIA